jgi:hypothetical protein
MEVEDFRIHIKRWKGSWGDDDSLETIENWFDGNRW